MEYDDELWTPPSQPPPPYPDSDASNVTLLFLLTALQGYNQGSIVVLSALLLRCPRTDISPTYDKLTNGGTGGLGILFYHWSVIIHQDTLMTGHPSKAIYLNQL